MCSVLEDWPPGFWLWSQNVASLRCRDGLWVIASVWWWCVPYSCSLNWFLFGEFVLLSSFTFSLKVFLIACVLLVNTPFSSSPFPHSLPSFTELIVLLYTWQFSPLSFVSWTSLFSKLSLTYPFAYSMVSANPNSAALQRCIKCNFTHLWSALRPFEAPLLRQKQMATGSISHWEARTRFLGWFATWSVQMAWTSRYSSHARRRSAEIQSINYSATSL